MLSKQWALNEPTVEGIRPLCSSAELCSAEHSWGADTGGGDGGGSVAQELAAQSDGTPFGPFFRPQTPWILLKPCVNLKKKCKCIMHYMCVHAQPCINVDKTHTGLARDADVEIKKICTVPILKWSEGRKEHHDPSSFLDHVQAF